jgi:hypothetical protein
MSAILTSGRPRIGPAAADRLRGPATGTDLTISESGRNKAAGYPAGYSAGQFLPKRVDIVDDTCP